MIFAIGTLGFWMLVALTFIIMIFLMEKDNFTWATIIFVASLLLLYSFGNGHELRDVGKWIVNNPGNFILIITCYLITGVIWSFVKWYKYLLKVKSTMGKENEIHSFTHTNIAKYNKEKIVHWMIYWPISLLWTLLDDPIKNVFNWIYSKISKSYQKMADRILKN